MGRTIVQGARCACFQEPHDRPEGAMRVFAWLWYIACLSVCTRLLSVSIAGTATGIVAERMDEARAFVGNA
eukprot:9417472-Lingulodinium_polyedra.AAC.1